MAAYYNEIDPDAVHVLRSLIADGLIAPGDVDSRSIKDVQPDDLDGYTQAHFFAGAGLWSVAARLAGWPDDRPLWTGSCPCQPFSSAGKGGGIDDPRHLWPDFFRLIRARRPAVVMGEQVAGAPGYGWFDGVRADLEREDFASRVVDIPACAVDAPHIRQRLWWCALGNPNPSRRLQSEGSFGDTGRWRSDADDRRSAVADTRSRRVRSGGPTEDPRPASGAGREIWEQRLRPDAWTGSSAVAMANADRPRSPEIRRDAGKVGDLSAAQRQSADDASLPWRGDATANDSLAAADAGVTQGDASGPGWEGKPHAERLSAGSPGRPDAQRADRGDRRPNGSAWAGADWLLCHDGKARRTEPGLRLLVDGMAGRVPAWRLAGNSISPVLAAEVIGALMDVMPEISGSQP